MYVQGHNKKYLLTIAMYQLQKRLHECISYLAFYADAYLAFIAAAMM